MSWLGLFAVAVLAAVTPSLGRTSGDEETKTFLGRYIIVAPKSVRPGSAVSLSVEILRELDGVDFEAQLRDMKNKTLSETRKQNLRRGQPSTIRIPPPKAGSLVEGQDYAIHVKGSVRGQSKFEDQTVVSLNSKSLSLFIQTDKAKYKPGGAVKYRIVVVKPDLKPFQGTVDMKITDPNGNVIAQLKKEKLDRGVLSKEMPLSEQPPLGAWQMEAKTSTGAETTKSFTVEKYVLPKFSVEIEKPDVALLGEDLVVVAKAKYTYGKPVDGPVKLEVRQRWEPIHSHQIFPGPPPPEYDADYDGPAVMSPPAQRLTQTGELKDGEFEATFTAQQLRGQNFMNDWGGDCKIVAEVTEDLTGIARQAEEVVSFERHRHNFDLQKSSENFKPGLPFSIHVSVTNKDGTPLRSSDSRKVKLDINYQVALPAPSTPEPGPNDPPPPPHVIHPGMGGGPTKSVKETKIVELGRDGTKTVQLTIPPKTESFGVDGYYMANGDASTLNTLNFWRNEELNRRVLRAGTHVQSAISASDAFLQVLPAKKGKLSAGSEASFEVKSTERLGKISFAVMSRGLVLHSGQASGRGTSATISFRTKATMAPKATLVVFTVLPANKEVIVDAVDFEVEGLFANDVKIKMSRTEAEPGNSISVRVKSDPGSLVNLLGVDQSVLLLGGDENDLRAEDVARDVEGYDSRHSGPWCCGPIPRIRRKRSTWIPWGISGRDAKSVFNNAGLVVLTDAWVFEEPRSPMFFHGPLAMAAPPPFMAEADDSGGAGGAFAAGAPLMARGNSFSGQGPQSSQPAKLRSEFPETWLWEDKTASSGNWTTFEAKVPDTISSFVVSAFAVAPSTGLGVAEEKGKFKVFRPFFAQLNLPYSVKRGEKLAVQVIVFNYMEREQTVNIRLKESDKFHFVERSGEEIKRGSKKSMATSSTREVKVKGGGGSAAVFFPIVPAKIGRIPLEVEATGSAGASDRLRKKLLVEPEGFQVEGNLPLTIDLSETPSFKRSLKAKVNFSDPGFVRGSLRTKVALIGDVMAPVLANIDDLVKMPYGCGEQNMINFVPNIVVMKYLKGTGRERPLLEAKAKSYMESGYQRELQYKRRDHSFSAFGDSDSDGSTWLTAFVLRSFHQAKPYIFIDEKVMKDSLGYLRKMQKRSGEYEEKHAVIHGELSGGGSAKGVPLTAYVVTTLLSLGEKDPKGLAYLERKLPSAAGNPYALALINYAFHLAGSKAKERSWRMLQKVGKKKGGFHFWQSKEAKKAKTDYWAAPPSADVEMSAYALHSFVLREALDKALPVVRWLAAQRNARGGWSSTQDTVVALSALGEYGAKAYTSQFDVNVKLSNGRSKPRTIRVTPRKSLTLFEYVGRDVRQPFQLEATGKGTVYAQLSWTYNVKTDSKSAPFRCTAKDVTPPAKKKDAKKRSAGAKDGRLVAEICCRYVKGGESESGMAVLEAEALSGYEFEADAVGALTELEGLQRAELTRSDTQANLYFESLGRRQKCFRLPSSRVALVAEQKPTQIRLYDYYKPEDRLEMKWSKKGRAATFAETCPDCWPNEDSTSLLLPSNSCRDAYPRCSNYCKVRKTKSSAYRKWLSKHTKWLRKYCKKSCASMLGLRDCFA